MVLVVCPWVSVVLCPGPSFSMVANGSAFCWWLLVGLGCWFENVCLVFCFSLLRGVLVLVIEHLRDLIWNRPKSHRNLPKTPPQKKPGKKSCRGLVVNVLVVLIPKGNFCLGGGFNFSLFFFSFPTPFPPQRKKKTFFPLGKLGPVTISPRKGIFQGGKNFVFFLFFCFDVILKLGL